MCSGFKNTIMETPGIINERIDISVTPKEKEIFLRTQKLSGDRTFSAFITRIVKSKSLELVLFDPKTQDKRKFSCEEESLTDYIQKQANQDIKIKLAACFVLLYGEENLIKGYYTLTSGSLNQPISLRNIKKKSRVNTMYL